MTIGILALQGDFAKHCAMVEKAGGIPLEVRTATDLSVCRGLIIPGGESTSICRQIDERGLREPLKEFGARRPVFGTCAGLIVMSRKVNKFPFKTFGWLDLTIERNAYGRQTDSFVTSVMLGMDSLNQTPYEAFFIRAPRIESVGADVQVFFHVGWRADPGQTGKLPRRFLPSRIER